MEVLVTYDVRTDSPAGRKRLRRVANVCLGYGQRVQYSVFECRVTPEQLVRLEHKLRQEIDEAQDSLRIYRLAGPREQVLTVIGNPPPNDFREPLVI